MSRDFALTVREEADVLDVIKGFSSEFLMNETFLPLNLSSHLMKVYPIIEYKVQVPDEKQKQSDDEEMK